MFDNAHRSDDETTPSDATGEAETEAFALPVDVAPDPEVRAELESRADGPDELTLFPADAEEFELMTTWLTAREGSYVALSEMR